jgi:pyridoxamine 5'-phosphate oxidase
MADKNKNMFLDQKEYELYEFKEEDLDPDPLKQFGKWYEEAIKANCLQPDAMTLATSTPDGVPSARMMLLKDFDQNGFLFYTNCDSRKGEDLSQNPRASIVFWWSLLERQVRIEGSITKVSEQEADAYFSTRPRGSCIGAWASNQSKIIGSRRVLDDRYNELEENYQGKEIPRPPYWMGYCLKPISIEFWQGRPNRLHDRIRYRLVQDGRWIIERLAP